MLQKETTLAIAVSTTETEAHAIDFDGERLETTKAGERDFAFSVNGTAATYTVQTSLDGTNWVDFDAGTAIGLGVYTIIRANDVLANYIRLKSSVATTAVVTFIARK